MTDQLRQRLARLDPMHPGVPVESVTTPSSQHLLEEIMSSPVTDSPEIAPEPAQRRWVGIAAVGALVVAIGGGIFLNGGLGSDPATPPLVLNAAGEDPMAMCIVFSVEELAKAPIAFEGTVTNVDGDTVTLDVDQWFKGGDATQVVLNGPQGLEALIAGIPFATGGQYLITAYGSDVNYCGFSGPASPELRSAFEQAFAG